MASKRRVRGANWSDGEMKTLIDYVAEHYSTLFDKLNVKVTRKKKNLMWQEVTEMLNERWGMNRPVRKIKRKWFELKACAVAFQTSRKNVPTCGGLTDEKPWYTDIILDIIGEDNDILNESDDGEESTDQYDPTFQNKEQDEHWHDDGSNSFEAAQSVVHRSGETMQAPWKRLLKTKPIQAASKNMCLQETFSTASDLETPHFHDSHLITKDRHSGFAEKRRRDTFDERETARAAKEKRTELINDSIGSRLTLENKKIDMELELMEVKLQAARKQHEMEVELLKIKTECSRLKHMKLYYEVRKLEKELGVPGETGVNTLMTSTIPVIDVLEVNQTQKVYS